jgi:transcriptional regulator with XRE-family HTH domain
MNLGKYIITLAKEKGLNQGILAEKLGISRPAVSLWNNGSNPNCKRVKQIAEVLGVSVRELYQGAADADFSTILYKREDEWHKVEESLDIIRDGLYKLINALATIKTRGQ